MCRIEEDTLKSMILEKAQAIPVKMQPFEHVSTTAEGTLSNEPRYDEESDDRLSLMCSGTTKADARGATIEDELNPAEVYDDDLLQQIGQAGIDKLTERIQAIREKQVKFTIFSRLPNEIRFAIWKEVAHHSRLIELASFATDDGEDEDELCDWADTPYDWRPMIHTGTRVAAFSRQPPAILETCHESRQEGKKFYQMTNMGRGLGINTYKGYTYYNPQSDIIYFGASSCVATLLHFCLSGAEIQDRPCQTRNLTDVGQPNSSSCITNRRIDTPRVAILIKSKDREEWCYEHLVEGVCCGNDWWTPEQHYGHIRYSESYLAKILHGQDATDTKTLADLGLHFDKYYNPFPNCNGLPGCRGLEMVFWVTEPEAWDIHPDVIDECVGLEAVGQYRPPTVDARAQLFDIECRSQTIMSEICQPGIRSNAWIGERMPFFQIMRFSTRTTSSKKHQVLVMRLEDIEPYYCLCVQELTYCKLAIYPGTWSGAGDYAIALHGSMEGVETARCVLEHLEISSSGVEKFVARDVAFPKSCESLRAWGNQISLTQHTIKSIRKPPSWSTA